MYTVLITGASSGLGKALSKKYAQNGYCVIAIARQREALIHLQRECHDFGGKIDIFTCDIEDNEHIKTLYSRIYEAYGSIDLLINNAGVGHFGLFNTLSSKQIHHMINLNLLGTIFMTQTFLPIIKGKIINIISTAGLKGKVNEAVYCASKFGVRGFTESLAVELKDTLQVVAVYMGGMATPFWNNTNHIKDKNRLKSADDVAKAIFLAEQKNQDIINL